jgi:hypothetical protein
MVDSITNDGKVLGVMDTYIKTADNAEHKLIKELQCENESTAEAIKSEKDASSNHAVACKSSRSDDTSDKVNIFGNSSNAHSAHLLPHAPNCASYWFPVVPLVLCTGTTTLTFDFLQACIHGTILIDETRSSDESTAKRLKKTTNVGIKHFSTNRIRLNMQADYFDSYPCVIIVPILSVELVRKWDGQAYNAIVLAGNFTVKNETKVAREITKEVVYREINSSDQTKGDESTYLATNDECAEACALLKEMVLYICKAFHERQDLYNSLESKAKEGKSNSEDKEIAKFDKWLKAINNLHMAPVPVQNAWNNAFKVRKISFSGYKDKSNRAPDPALLLAKSANNWLRRHDIEILPACEDAESCYTTDDSADSVVSIKEDIKSKEEGWLHAGTTKKPKLRIVEVDIHQSKDDVDEPLSDDEWFSAVTSNKRGIKSTIKKESMSYSAQI